MAPVTSCVSCIPLLPADKVLKIKPRDRVCLKHVERRRCCIIKFLYRSWHKLPRGGTNPDPFYRNKGVKLKCSHWVSRVRKYAPMGWQHLLRSARSNPPQPPHFLCTVFAPPQHLCHPNTETSSSSGLRARLLNPHHHPRTVYWSAWQVWADLTTSRSNMGLYLVGQYLSALT